MIFETIKAQILQYASIIMIVTIIGLGSFIAYQKFCLLEKDNDIITLQAEIKDMNAKFEATVKERDFLQSSLELIGGTNKYIAKQVKELKDQIDNRPPPKDCGEAVQNIGSTAKIVADEWNTK